MSWDSVVTVITLVELITMLGLTDGVSDALGNRTQKESETNVKIVDLLKHTLDDIKNYRNEDSLRNTGWSFTF